MIILLQKVVSAQQAGALPGRSATNLLACVTYEIEHALENQGTAAILTLDVKNALDTTLRRRLILRLIRQGWPRSLVRFIGSFIENRQASIRLDDITTQPGSIRCGLPQGSPLSPTLFLLYIADVCSEDRVQRFRYADYICVVQTEETL